MGPVGILWKQSFNEYKYEIVILILFRQCVYAESDCNVIHVLPVGILCQVFLFSRISAIRENKNTCDDCDWSEERREFIARVWAKYKTISLNTRKAILYAAYFAEKQLSPLNRKPAMDCLDRMQMIEKWCVPKLKFITPCPSDNFESAVTCS